MMNNSVIEIGFLFVFRNIAVKTVLYLILAK
jgi:hypothetical protein